MQNGFLIRTLGSFLLLVAVGCGSGEAKVEQDTTSVRRIGNETGSPEERIAAIQNSPIPDDVKAKKIASIKGGG